MTEDEKDIAWKWFAYGMTVGIIFTIVLVVAVTYDVIVYGCAP